MVFNPFRGLSSLGPWFDPNNDDHFNALKQHLGFSDEPVQDTEGRWTIGHGQRLSDTPGGPKPAATMSEPFASDMLRQQLAQDTGTQVADASLPQISVPLSSAFAQSTNAKGFTQLPQNVPDSGYYNYGTPANGAAQYGTPETIDFIKRAGAAWKDSGHGPMGIGNMSLNDGTAYDGHKNHGEGLSIDIRPPRKDGQQSPTNISSPEYDQEAARQLVGTLRNAGDVESIFFNDSKIPGVQPLPGAEHDNHIHVKLKPPRRY